MNYNVIISLISSVLRFLGLMMLIPLVVAIWYGENYDPFLISAVITFIFGVIFATMGAKTAIGFLVGAVASFMAGYIGMRVSVTAR